MIIYPDNSVAQRCLEDPAFYLKMRAQLQEVFGFQPKYVVSYYLFFEYFGLRGLKIARPNDIVEKFKRPKGQTVSMDQLIKEIPVLFDQLFDEGVNMVRNDLLLKEAKIKELIAERESREAQGTLELKDSLFGAVLGECLNDFSSFAYAMALHFIWDFHCQMNVSGYLSRDIRQLQLKFWNDFRNKGWVFPLGKIADDFVGEHIDMTLLDNTEFHSGDWVDTEGITRALIGYSGYVDNKLEPVCFITFDNHENVKQRLKLELGALKNFEDSTKKYSDKGCPGIVPVKIDRVQGLVCCIDRDSGAIIETYEPRFEEIELRKET